MLLFFKAVESKTKCVAKEIKFRLCGNKLWNEYIYDYLGKLLPNNPLIVVLKEYNQNRFRHHPGLLDLNYDTT